MPYMQHNNEWIEVFNNAPERCSPRWYAVDARITRWEILGELHQNKPDWKPSESVGEKIYIKYRRVIQQVEEHKGLHLEPQAMWGEIDEVCEAFVVSVEIMEVQGFEHTHRCGYCKEYAATDPDEYAPCKGCGKVGYWEPWEGEAPSLGPLDPPKWAAKRIKENS